MGCLSLEMMQNPGGKAEFLVRLIEEISDVICIVPPLSPAKCQPFVSLVSMVCADLLTDNLGFITNNSCLIPCVVLTHRRSVGAKNPGVSK